MKGKKKKKTKKDPTFDCTMQEAYEKAFRLVEQGVPFRVDLARGSMTVGGHHVVMDGAFLGRPSGLDTKDPIADVERLYADFKRSVPGERDSRREFNGEQFRAMRFDELSDDDLLYGERREHARFRLEAFVLLAAASGQLRWKDEWGSWFWRSSKDPDLVILRKWIDGKERA